MSKPTRFIILEIDVLVDKKEPYAEITKSLNLLTVRHTTIRIRAGRVGHNFPCNLALLEDLSICSVNSSARIFKEWGMK
jgi:hypothetical protein